MNERENTIREDGEDLVNALASLLRREMRELYQSGNNKGRMNERENTIGEDGEDLDDTVLRRMRAAYNQGYADGKRSAKIAPQEAPKLSPRDVESFLHSGQRHAQVSLDNLFRVMEVVAKSVEGVR
jgi:hypothetical protein